MELVQGAPITRYCDQHRLTPRQRLELLVLVCHAIQHAHQKGIIHRDIKPSNVLVALCDDRPLPKVIDFGLAKATGRQLTERTLDTGFGAVIGTLEYMSPEQAGCNQQDVDTRSDVYSLGVLLYELLTGSRPFSRKELEQAGMLEMLRVIREQEPARPSTKLSTAEGLPTLAANRGMEPARLTRLVRGELDWIAMKALEKDRSRRYESATAFAQDVQRYLNDEPVQACPPSAAYRAGKFVRRHKLALGATALVSAALLLAVVVLAVSNVRIEAESTARAAAQEAKEQALADKLQEEEKRREEEEKRRKEAEGRARDNEGWRQTAYYQKTARILAECQRSNLALAEELLDECPKDLRHWEWGYLKRLCHAEVRGVPIDSPNNWRQAAFSPGATHLVTVDLRNVLHVHDLATGKETLTRPVAGFGPGFDVRFSADGKRLALFGRDGQANYDPFDLNPRKPPPGLLQIWDAATGEQCLAVKAPAAKDPWGEFWSVAFNPRRPHVAVSDLRGHVMALDLETGEELWRIDAYPVTPAPTPNHIWYTLVTYSPDGAQLVTEVSKGEEVKIWDAQTGELRRTLQGKRKPNPWIFFSPRGTWLFSVGPDEREVQFCNPATGETLQTVRSEQSPFTAVVFSADESRMAAGTEDGKVKIWDLAARRYVGEYRTSTGNVHRMAFTAAGDQVATFNFRSAAVVRFWDATRGPEARVWPRPAYRAVFSPDGRRVAATTVVQRRGYVLVWDAETGRELLKLGDPDEMPFAVGVKEIVIDGVPVKVGDANDMPFAVAFSPDGAFIAAAVSTTRDEGMVRIWDARTGKLVRTLAKRSDHVRVEREIGEAATTAARLLTYAGGAAALAPAGAPLGPLAQMPNFQGLRGKVFAVPRGAPCDAVAWSADGKFIASGGQDRAVRVWDAATGEQLWASKTFYDDPAGAHNRTISGLAFSRDGRRLVSATGGIARVGANLAARVQWITDTDSDIPDLKV
jgi:WD40 repeat protein